MMDIRFIFNFNIIIILLFNINYINCINLRAQSPNKQSFTVAQMTLFSADPEQNAVLKFGVGSEEWAQGVNKDGYYVQHNNEELMRIDTNGNVRLRSQVTYTNKMACNKLSINGVVQYQLAAVDDFSQGVNGWSRTGVTKCAGLTILTGDGPASQDPSVPAFAKTFQNLPPHKEFRIQCTGHCIDGWDGETAYLRVDGQMVWTHSCGGKAAKGRVNICGSERYPEVEFSVPILVTIPHTKNDVTLEFGSTLPNGAVALFGISRCDFLIRDP